tara:strand:- start:337 stop:510 length:174 start_codon:yes stop_codon:yes gene_type:complete
MNIEEMKNVIVYLTDKVQKLEQENIALSNQKLCECVEEDIKISPAENIINLFPNAKS